jgi:hypothetical protein
MYQEKERIARYLADWSSEAHHCFGERSFTKWSCADWSRFEETLGIGVELEAEDCLVWFL